MSIHPDPSPDPDYHLMQTPGRSEPFAQGGFAALYKARLHSKDRARSKIVVVKVPDKGRIANRKGTECVNARAKTLERWQREIRAGQSVSHPNIIRAIDFCNNPDPAYKEFIGIILPYCENGNASSYIELYPKVDRLRILVLVAAALFALHDRPSPVVHGDIKAANILVDEEGNPLLADFGLSRVCNANGFTTKNLFGSVRWMAPELLCALSGILHCYTSEEQVRITRASDIWAFSMTILELLTGKFPFSEYFEPGVIVGIVSHQARPERPQVSQVSDALWTLLQSCWEEEPSRRPDARHVGLVLDLVYCLNGRDIDASTVSILLNGGLDDALPHPSASLKLQPSLPYACKWLHCRQAFGTIEDCVAHEYEEFEMRARR